MHAYIRPISNIKYFRKNYYTFEPTLKNNNWRCISFCICRFRYQNINCSSISKHKLQVHVQRLENEWKFLLYYILIWQKPHAKFVCIWHECKIFFSFVSFAVFLKILRFGNYFVLFYISVMYIIKGYHWEYRIMRSRRIFSTFFWY